MSAHKKNRAWQAMLHGHVANGEENLPDGRWTRKDGAYYDGVRARATVNKVRNRKNHDKRTVKPLLGVARRLNATPTASTTTTKPANMPAGGAA